MKSRFLNDNDELFIRASSIGKIMTSGKKAGELSVGAKTYIKELFKQYWYGFEDKLEGKELSKGIIMEEQAIELVSEVYDMKYVKNEVTITNDYIKGTCDIDGGDHIRDIKCSWSKKSFPFLPEDARNPIYEWQVRAYMMLYGRDYGYVDYCLMPTPLSLIPAWEDMDMHKVDGLDIKSRVTTIEIVRDLSKEAEMIHKVQLARNYWNELITIMKNK